MWNQSLKINPFSPSSIKVMEKNSETHRNTGNLSINFLGKLTMGQTQDNQELIGGIVKELT